MKSLEIINKIESKKVELGMNVELGLLQETFSKIDNINNESKKSFEMVKKAKTLLFEAEGFAVENKNNGSRIINITPRKIVAPSTIFLDKKNIVSPLLCNLYVNKLHLT